MKTKSFPLSKLTLGLLSGLTLALVAQAGQGPQPSICVRSCWGARAPNCSISQMSGLTRAIIHHTASTGDYNTTSQAQSAANVRAAQNYHMDSKGWCDIAYHFLVDKLGNIFEGRSGSMTALPRGTHDGNNGNSFGFNIMGYYHGPYNNTPTDISRSKLYDVIAWRMPSAWSPYGAGSYNGTTVGFLDGHRKVKATACPGDLVHPPYITENYNGGEMRDQVNLRKNPAPPPPPPVAAAGQRIRGDFTGDGKEDAIIAYDYGSAHTALWLFASTGTSFAAPVVWWSSGVGNWEGPRSNWTAGDFNNDGKSDVACMYNYPGNSGALFVFISTGSGFAAPALWWASGANNWDATRSKIVAGDFTGDGKSDVAAAYDYGSSSHALFVFPSTGTSFTGSFVWWSSGAGNWISGSQWLSGDFNNDGKKDVAASYYYGSGNTALYVFPSTGSGFSGAALWWASGAGNWEAPRSTFMSGDFNADGKTDVMASYDYGNNSNALYMFPSGGSSFGSPALWWASGAGNWVASASKWVSGDFTGDGKADVGSLYNYGNGAVTLFTFPSTGSSFTGTQAWWGTGSGWEWIRSILF